MAEGKEKEREGQKAEEILIRVCDEGRGVTKNFQCNKDILVLMLDHHQE